MFVLSFPVRDRNVTAPWHPAIVNCVTKVTIICENNNVDFDDKKPTKSARKTLGNDLFELKWVLQHRKYLEFFERFLICLNLGIKYKLPEGRGWPVLLSDIWPFHKESLYQAITISVLQLWKLNQILITSSKRDSIKRSIWLRKTR